MVTDARGRYRAHDGRAPHMGTEEIKESQQTRVARGIEWLDADVPEWWKRVDPDTLDMTNSERCVMAQLTGLTFSDAIRSLRVDLYTAVRMGFITYYPDSWGYQPQATAELTPLWQAVIRRKRDGAALALATALSTATELT